MLDGFVPFPREFATRYRQNDDWEDRSMGQVFMECFARYADRIAVVDGCWLWDGGQRLACLAALGWKEVPVVKLERRT